MDLAAGLGRAVLFLVQKIQLIQLKGFRIQSSVWNRIPSVIPEFEGWVETENKGNKADSNGNFFHYAVMLGKEQDEREWTTLRAHVPYLSVF